MEWLIATMIVDFTDQKKKSKSNVNPIPFLSWWICLLLSQSAKRFRSKRLYKIKIQWWKMAEPSAKSLVPNKGHHEQMIHFLHVFRPIYYCARICGLMSFSIVPANVQRELCEPRVSKCDCLWFAISTCFYLAMVSQVFCVKSSLYVLDVRSNAIVLGNLLLRIMILIFGIFVLTMNMYNRYELVNILNRFTIFDHEVNLSYLFICWLNWRNCVIF